VLLVALVVLVTPWYQITTSNQASQTFTSEFGIPSTNYQSITPYSLPRPVNFATMAKLPIAKYLGLFYITPNFTLQVDLTYELTTTMNCQCWVQLFVAANSYNGSFGVTIIGSGQRSFTPPFTGDYYIYIQPDPMSTIVIGGVRMAPLGTVSTVVVTGVEAQTVAVPQTTYWTKVSTVYSQLSVPPYASLGSASTTLIVLLLCALVAIAVVIDRNLLRPSRTRHKRRR